MAENKELKPKSFRIDDATAEKFKEISAQIGGNQQEAMAKLIEAYELQGAKVSLTDKKSDIEQFEAYVTCLTRMYMGSLEDYQNVTETVRSQFAALLDSKDTTIQDLQAQLIASKESEKSALQDLKQKTDEADAAKMELERTTAAYEKEKASMLKMIHDKEELNHALAESCRALKSELEKIGDMQEQIKNSKETERKVSELEIRLKNQELQHEKEKFNAEKLHFAEITDLKKKYAEEIEHYQTQIKNLLQEIHKPEQE